MNKWLRLSSLVLGCACIGAYFESGLLASGIYWVVCAIISENWNEY